ncbi:hypothetical protein BJ508DRAFT_305688 [Ascobolus immersus RN42]|uniref:Uncharacterized protein n=1 Tax=Ascobolus immersus RN42 TaxID=1160509 RepID=A0A3N4IA00_ASCIM|nr:hypothetical protein BJ508DRAFT_305688 [Ascobolus immersus RN42]
MSTPPTTHKCQCLCGQACIANGTKKLTLKTSTPSSPTTTITFRLERDPEYETFKENYEAYYGRSPPVTPYLCDPSEMTVQIISQPSEGPISVRSGVRISGEYILSISEYDEKSPYSSKRSEEHYITCPTPQATRSNPNCQYTDDDPRFEEIGKECGFGRVGRTRRFVLYKTEWYEKTCGDFPLPARSIGGSRDRETIIGYSGLETEDEITELDALPISLGIKISHTIDLHLTAEGNVELEMDLPPSFQGAGIWTADKKLVGLITRIEEAQEGQKGKVFGVSVVNSDFIKFIDSYCERHENYGSYYDWPNGPWGEFLEKVDHKAYDRFMFRYDQERRMRKGMGPPVYGVCDW